MKKFILLSIFFISASFFNITWADIYCVRPKVIKRMPNWQIITTSVATISAASTFKGTNLRYSISYESSPSNDIDINTKTGVITVNAISKEDIDVKLIAQNDCGIAKDVFNIHIDEDE